MSDKRECPAWCAYVYDEHPQGETVHKSEPEGIMTGPVALAFFVEQDEDGRLSIQVTAAATGQEIKAELTPEQAEIISSAADEVLTQYQDLSTI